jgi:hypothetical protein
MMFRKINISSLLVLLLAIIATSFLVEADKNATAVPEDMMDMEDGMDKDGMDGDMDKDGDMAEWEEGMDKDGMESHSDSSSSTVAVSASALAVTIISMVNLN